MSYRTLIAIGLLAASAPALAGTPINQTRPLALDGLVHIENVKGRVVVRTWSQPQVRVTGTLGKGAEKLDIHGDAHALSIEVKYPNSGRGWNLWGSNDRAEPSIIEVMLPGKASLEVEAVSADVDVQQMAGRRLAVSSVSGDVVVTASSPGEARFENVSGDTLLKITSAKVHAESVSGDISLQGGLTGEVGLESVSGNLTLRSGALNQLKANSVSGDEILSVSLRPGGSIKAETLSGDVELDMPRNSNARLHVETFSGDIRSAEGRVDREEHGPGKSLDTTVGNGDGQIKLESFSGDVRLQLR